MRKLAITLALTLGLASSASAAVIHYVAILGPEAVGATGTGTVHLYFDDVLHDLTIDADWAGLSGTTTVSHIHCCTAVPGTGTVGVAVTPGTLPGFPAGLTAGSYDATVDLDLAASFTGAFLAANGGTPASAQAALFAGILANRAYFNIHTNRFPGGEIRGFLQVPEPVSLSLLGLGLAAAAIRRRRRA